LSDAAACELEDKLLELKRLHKADTAAPSQQPASLESQSLYGATLEVQPLQDDEGNVQFLKSLFEAILCSTFGMMSRLLRNLRGAASGGRQSQSRVYQKSALS